MSVIDIRTRQTIDAQPVAVDDPHITSRQQRTLRAFLIDVETFGIRWTEVRAWLVNALAYVDAKIVADQHKSRK